MSGTGMTEQETDEQTVDKRGSAGHIDDRGRRANRLRRAWQRIPGHWKFVVGLFLAAKVVFTLLGLLAIWGFDNVLTATPANDIRSFTDTAQHDISSHRSVSMWFVWDSFLYLGIERGPLLPRDPGALQFKFLPLYPLLGRLVTPLLGGRDDLALLLVSNVAFLMLLYYGYRLGQRLLGDDDAARRFTRYLVLLPAAFLFQAALTESLFLCLVLACFYYAEGRKWVQVGLIGFFLALSRSTGFLVVIPLALVLLQQNRYRLGPAALLRYVRSGWPLLLVPAGWLTFMAYCWWLTGDWLRYKHLQEQGWGIILGNPVRQLWRGLHTPAIDAIRVWFAVAFLALTAACVRYIKQIKPGYLVYVLISVMVPLSIGPPVYKSLIRYLVVVFPLCLLFAIWSRRHTVDVYLTAGLALLQGVLLVLWVNPWTTFII
jgi:hypothetical protein